MPRGSKNKGLHANLKRGAKAASKHKGIQARKAMISLFETYANSGYRAAQRQHACAVEFSSASLAHLINGYGRR